MWNSLVPAMFGLLGAVIGSSGSAVIIFLQTRAENRRARYRLALEAALAEFNCDTDYRKKTGGSVAPLSMYLHYHVQVLEAIESGSLDAEKLAELLREHNEMLKAVVRAERA
jgi:hypothetical protein